jgi:hypothetical protein
MSTQLRFVYRSTPLAQVSLLPDLWGHGTLSELFSPAAVLPEQFSDSSDNVYKKVWGEVALMRAVLEDALNCFHKQFVSDRAHDQRLAREAHEWLFAEDDHWPFSFVNICTVLGLDPEYLRRGLRSWRQSHPAKRWKKRRHATLRRRRTSSAA